LKPFVQREPTDAEIIATFGPPERVNLEMLLRNPQIGRPGAERFLDEAERRYHEHYEGRHDAVQLFPGIREVLRLVRGFRWPVGVFTGKSQRSALFALRHVQLESLVDHVIGGDQVARPKPDPEGLLRLADAFGLLPEQVLFVGDSPGDVFAGRAAGAFTVGALWGAFRPEATVAAGPTWVCQSVQELHGLIRRLRG
ncbi:MAG: HAD family hydrolase, partial [Gemmatales bacterium]|nr:HAD family hydrolase [Gemmatales bacterium]MDW8386841.1 HAD family hydrolase [Gemmatales bacterium]